MTLDPTSYISSPYGSAFPLPGGAGVSAAPAADTLPPEWTEADLDAALFACASEPWADEVLTGVLVVLAPLLSGQGFLCGAPEALALRRQFGRDYAVMHVARMFEVGDPLGATHGQRLQASVSLGIVTRLGGERRHPETNAWLRNARNITSLTVSIGYATASGDVIPGAAAPVASVQLALGGGDLVVSDVAELCAWWRGACGIEALQATVAMPLMMPTLDALWKGKPEEPQTLVLRLETLVDKCVCELAP